MVVYLPAVLELQDNVAVPEPITLLGDIAPHVSPPGTVFVSEIVPLNPLTEVNVMIEFAAWPALTVPGELAEIAKFGSGLKNSVIGVAAASLDVRAVRFQFTSMVFVREYWL